MLDGPPTRAEINLIGTLIALPRSTPAAHKVKEHDLTHTSGLLLGAVRDMWEMWDATWDGNVLAEYLVERHPAHDWYRTLLEFTNPRNVCVEAEILPKYVSVVVRGAAEVRRVRRLNVA